MFRRRKEPINEFCFEIKASNETNVSIDAVKLVRSIINVYPKALLKIETVFTSRAHRSLIRVILPPDAEVGHDFTRVLETILQSLLPPDVSCVHVKCDDRLPF